MSVTLDKTAALTHTHWTADTLLQCQVLVAVNMAPKVRSTQCNTLNRKTKNRQKQNQCCAGGLPPHNSAGNRRGLLLSYPEAESNGLSGARRGGAHLHREALLVAAAAPSQHMQCQSFHKQLTHWRLVLFLPVNITACLLNRAAAGWHNRTQADTAQERQPVGVSTRWPKKRTHSSLQTVQCSANAEQSKLGAQSNTAQTTTAQAMQS